MRLEKASRSAIEFACKRYHYSKTVPVHPVGYSVFENDEFCGVIIYSLGANNRLSQMFNKAQGEVIELVRVALNGKQEITSKAVALSLKLIKKDAPLAKIVVSYADESQGHKGTIYQATNWMFTGDSFAEKAVDPADGKAKHTRILHSKYGTVKGLTRVKELAKHRYIYILRADKAERIELEKLRKSYPKANNAEVV